jgi:hypothetical protein
MSLGTITKSRPSTRIAPALPNKEKAEPQQFTGDGFTGDGLKRLEGRTDLLSHSSLLQKRG